MNTAQKYLLDNKLNDRHLNDDASVYTSDAIHNFSERLEVENKQLLSQVKIAQEISEELGIIGMVGSIAWKAQMLRLKI